MSISPALLSAYRFHKAAVLNGAAAARAVNPSPYMRALRGNASATALKNAYGDLAAGIARYPAERIYPAVSWQREPVAHDPIGTWANPFPRKPARLAHVETPANAGLREVGRVMPECGGRDGYWDTRGDCGWHTDPGGDVFKDGTGLCYGVVYQLPGRNGKARFVAGYQFGGHDAGPTMDFSRIYEEATDCYSDNRDCDAAHEAARAADDMAKRAAEEEREYQAAWQAGARWRDLGEEVAETRRDILEFMKEHRAARRAVAGLAVGTFNMLCDAARQYVASRVRDISKARAERAKLAAGDYVKEYLPGFYVNDSRLQAAFCEGADLQTFPAH